MAITLTTTSTQFDSSKPIRETIKASGRTIVTGANAICNGIALVDDMFVLARLTLEESLIEARVDAKRAEIVGLTELHKRELEYQATLASLKA